jgi:hypothetical protein
MDEAAEMDEGDLVVEGIAELRKLCDLLEVLVEVEALSLATVFRVNGKLDRRAGVECDVELEVEGFEIGKGGGCIMILFTAMKIPEFGAQVKYRLLLYKPISNNSLFFPNYMVPYPCTVPSFFPWPFLSNSIPAQIPGLGPTSPTYRSTPVMLSSVGIVTRCPILFDSFSLLA